MDLLERAMTFAIKAHTGQRDHGGAVYVLHPIRVMLTLQKQGFDEIVLAAAVLHDVVEDTDVTLSNIYNKFGYPVGHLVELLTAVDETYNDYIKRLSGNAYARAIKMVDLKDNADLDRPSKKFSLQKRYAESYRYLKDMED